ncbi:hypothetical protein V8E36_002719 [Tilletia maclaganii]
MSYALLVNLAPEYGLYSSFAGVMIYALFTTSKDGPVAVMSLQVGNTITRVFEKHPNQWFGAEIASDVAFLCGVPKLLGLTVTTNGVSTYKVIIDSLKALPQTSTPPSKYTVGKKPKYPISILKDVPRGFKHTVQPNLSTGLLSAIAPELSVSVIVLLLEHIAIAQSFGRVNNYKINPNQELMAIGVTKMLGPCFGADAATASFSRTAIRAKFGVRTPIAGWVTGIVVGIAICALTGTFYWISQPALSAVIIHVIGDLIAPLSAAYQFWLVQPLEFCIFMDRVITTIFTTIDIGIYVTIASSLALLLVRPSLVVAGSVLFVSSTRPRSATRTRTPAKVRELARSPAPSTVGLVRSLCLNSSPAFHAQGSQWNHVEDCQATEGQYPGIYNGVRWQQHEPWPPLSSGGGGSSSHEGDQHHAWERTPPPHKAG